jgi:nucleoside-diphosphate-sugar epimerase
MTAAALAGQRVLVVGAAGFLGTRLTERLARECRAEVRVLVRRVMSAASLARFPVDLRIGDVLDEAALAGAVQGCSVVFNCVKGKGGDADERRRTDVEGARLVVESAARVGARVVHVSTMAVYDRPDDGVFDETAPPAPTGDPYTDNKRDGERAALEAGARLGTAVIVVQPTVIYGPHAGVYGTDILEEMRTHRLILVDGGAGICNALFIDDAVSGLLLAATAAGAGGERVLLSGPEHPTWRDFFAYFEQLRGAPGVIAMPAAAALRLWEQSTHRPWLLPEVVRTVVHNVPVRRRLLATREGAVVRELADRALPDAWRQRLRGPAGAAASAGDASELPVAAVRPWVIQNMARKARARIDKARGLLGYEPVFRLDDGMRLTADWARWANLAP